MSPEPAVFPSFEEGSLRPTNKCHATLIRAQRGRSDVSQRAFDLPGRAESRTVHLLDRRGQIGSGCSAAPARLTYLAPPRGAFFVLILSRGGLAFARSPLANFRARLRRAKRSQGCGILAPLSEPTRGSRTTNVTAHRLCLKGDKISRLRLMTPCPAND